ncbi:glucose-6-phosphate isomerase [Tepidamorphus gemmatus]|uniref:Glucose-6-phosphate isomerase n=1 Tax=Tepidamorphus gemmatus TaxID=747076 RepID=A0A4R3MCL1_9HYPH|nr:glucose-6-phosphate isomerase [Tepidamorphus gemmatus]TCT09989.1 glucose-6-phosphate isomerase [Tepidamorphus gemmatus]
MPLKQIIDTCFDTEVGANGLDRAEFDTVLKRTEPGLVWLREAYDTGALPLLALPGRDDDLPEITEAAAWLADGATDVLVLGTGGSSLGGQALAQVAGWRLPVLGDLSGRPRLHFLDNLDPLSLQSGLAALPLETTRVIAISKSGSTGETLMQAMAVISAFEERGLADRIGAHMLGLSEPLVSGRLNKLRKLLEPYGIRFLDHDPGVGGRFAALTNVGLIPAAIRGLDIAAVRRGAQRVLQPVLDHAAAAEVPAAVGAALSVAFAERRLPIDVMFAYGDRLERFTRWWVQLWSESLGKQGRGMTPVAAIGPVDQHSQLQLYLDGPVDKLFTVITTECADAGPRIDAALAAEAGQPEFAGRTVGDLVASQQRATVETLARNGRPVRVINAGTIDAETIGALMMQFMLETIIAAHLLGVDAFDQPAVEEGKVLARTYLEEM